MTESVDTPRSQILAAAQSQIGIDLVDLWLGFMSVGGDKSLATMREWLDGTREPSTRDYDLTAHALNELFVDRGLGRVVPYCDEL